MSDLIKLRPLIKNLEDLATIKASAAVAYGDAIKAASEECEIKTTQLRKFIAARIADSTAEEIENTEELLSLLESIA